MGDYPIKILELEVGVRRPLGVGAGGLAILCRMQPAEADGIIRANDHRYEKFAGFTSDFVRKSLALGVERGYTFLEHVVTPGSAAIGVAFPPQNPVGAISIAALATRLDERRRAQLAEKMQREVEGINAALAQTSA
jgi:DNA-binding IclR family transcriptional regulator